MTSKPTGTVTFLFTDIENSTPLASRHDRASAPNAGSRLPEGFQRDHRNNPLLVVFLFVLTRKRSLEYNEFR